MPTCSFQDVQNHMDKFYLTMEQLAEKSDSTQAEIFELIETQCVPPHSYELRNTTLISDAMVEEAIQAPTIKYYHPSNVDWINHAKELLQQHSFSETANIIRSDFNEQFDEEFAGAVTPGCKNFENAWRYLMTGVWGICLIEVTVDCMARKELSRLKIANLSKLTELNDSQKQELILAIDTYNGAAKEFAPHFHHRSSRCNEVEAAIKRFLQ